MDLYSVKHSDRYYLIKNCGDYDTILISNHSPELLRNICHKLNHSSQYTEKEAFAEFYKANGYQSILSIMNLDEDVPFGFAL